MLLLFSENRGTNSSNHKDDGKAEKQLVDGMTYYLKCGNSKIFKAKFQKTSGTSGADPG